MLRFQSSARLSPSVSTKWLKMSIFDAVPHRVVSMILPLRQAEVEVETLRLDPFRYVVAFDFNLHHSRHQLIEQDLDLPEMVLIVLPLARRSKCQQLIECNRPIR